MHVPVCPGQCGGVKAEKEAADGGAEGEGNVQGHNQGLLQGSEVQCRPKQREG